MPEFLNRLLKKDDRIIRPVGSAQASQQIEAEQSFRPSEIEALMAMGTLGKLSEFVTLFPPNQLDEVIAIFKSSPAERLTADDLGAFALVGVTGAAIELTFSSFSSAAVKKGADHRLRIQRFADTSVPDEVVGSLTTAQKEPDALVGILDTSRLFSLEHAGVQTPDESMFAFGVPDQANQEKKVVALLPLFATLPVPGMSHMVLLVTRYPANSLHISVSAELSMPKGTKSVDEDILDD